MAISCRDRQGRPVRCDDNWWHVHIIQNHPEIEDLRRELIRTIESPEEEYLDANHPKRLVYYSPKGVGILTASEMLKVSVEYDEYDEGGLITAYTVIRVKRGEKLLWRRQSTQ